jgi:hypothetical protein
MDDTDKIGDIYLYRCKIRSDHSSNQLLETNGILVFAPLELTFQRLPRIS